MGPTTISVAARAAPPAARSPRLRSLDALRGLAVALMVVVDSVDVLGAAPAPLRHAAWHGLTVADTVFPAFLFAAGVSVPLSSRSSRPRPVLRRALTLFALGCLLTSVKYGHLVVAGVLQHVAGSYLLGWLVLRLRPAARWAALAALAGGAWAAFTFLRLPGVTPGSWAPGRTPAAWLDTLLYGGPQTEGLSATLLGSISVVLGGIAGAHLRRGRGSVPAALVGYAALLLAVGAALATVIPVNKHLWTPSYAVLTGGVVALALAALHARLDGAVAGGPAPSWARPLLDLGANALPIFVLAQLLLLAGSRIAVPLLPALAVTVGATAASLLYAAALTGGCWAVAAGMRRRGVVVTV